jgi:hypothetical protein
MRHKKELWIRRCIQIGIILILVVLAIKLPSNMERKLTILTTSGESRMCYYIPGNLVSIDSDEENLIQSVTKESRGYGTLLQIELYNDPYIPAPIDHISICYTKLGKKEQSQKVLTEDLESVQWAKEYPVTVVDGLDDGYYMTAKSLDAGLISGTILTSSNRNTDQQVDYIIYIIYIIIATITLIILELIAKILIYNQRKRNRRYQELRDFLDDYLVQRWREEEHWNYAVWMKKIVRNRRCIFDMSFILFVPLFMCLLAIYDYFNLTMHEMTLGIVLIAVVICVYDEIRIIKTIYKLNEIAKNDGLAAVWCYYNFKFNHPIERIWSRLDMNFSMYMNKAHDYETSIIFADLLWNKLKYNRNSGSYYVQYHLLQYKNFHMLGKEDEATYHLEQTEKELVRNPNKKYYKLVTEQINKIKHEM